MADVPFDKTSYKFDDLEKKYRSFFAPAYEVVIDGVNLIRQSVAITSVTVNTTAQSKYDTCSFTVSNAYDLVKRDFQWLDTYFVLGKYVEVKFGYVDKFVTVFYGVIHKVDLKYPSDGNPTITVAAADLSFLMQKGSTFVQLKNKKFSDVAKDIGGQYGLSVEADDTKITHLQIPRFGKDDFTFLRELAQQIHYEFFVVGKKMYFRKKVYSQAPVVTLMFGKHLRSFSTSMDLSEQVSKVIVHGQLPDKPELIEATAESVTKIGSNSKTGKDIIKSVFEKTETIYTNATSMDEAQMYADAILNRRAMELIKGDGECIGLPEMRAGLFVKLEGVGKKFNQPLYLESVTHSITSGGYITKFNVRGNAV